MALGAGRPGPVERRVRAALDARRNRRPLRAGGAIALVLLAACFTAASATSGCQADAAGVDPSDPGVPSAEALAEMDSDALIAEVIAAAERRQAASADWRNLFLDLEWAEEQRDGAGTWSASGPRTRLNLWLADRDGSRYRADFVPEVLPWHNGAAPLNETRYSERWDGDLFRKVDWIYGKKSGTYGGRVSQERDQPTTSQSWDPRERLHRLLWTLLDDRSAAAGLEWLSRPDFSAATRGESLSARWHEGRVQVAVAAHLGSDNPSLQILSFDPGHSLRLAEMFACGTDDAGNFDPTQRHDLFEVLAWEAVPGTSVVLPARWTEPAHVPDLANRHAARTVHTLHAIRFFDEGDTRMYGVEEAELKGPLTEPFPRPAVRLRDTP